MTGRDVALHVLRDTNGHENLHYEMVIVSCQFVSMQMYFVPVRVSDYLVRVSSCQLCELINQIRVSSCQATHIFGSC